MSKSPESGPDNRIPLNAGGCLKALVPGWLFDAGKQAAPYVESARKTATAIASDAQEKAQLAATSTKEKALTVAGDVRRSVENSNLPDRLTEARDNVQAIAVKTGEVAKKTPAAVDKALTKSRESRLKLEAERQAGHQNFIQRVFDSGPGGWVAKNSFEAIPVIGDGATIMGAFTGRDVLTGRKLDKVDRWIYLGAGLSTPIGTLITPIVPPLGAILVFTPATVIADSVRGARISAEELNYASQTGDVKGMAVHGNRLKDTLRQTWKIIQHAKNKE